MRGWWLTKPAQGNLQRRRPKMREEGKSAEEVKDALWIPSVHGFNKLVGKFISDRCQDHQAMLEATKLWESQGGWRTVVEHIRHCKISNMYQSIHERFKISVPMAHTLMVLRPHIETVVPTDVQALSPSWAWDRIVAEMRKSKGYQT